MSYILDKTIKFCTIEKGLRCIGSGDFISLPYACNKILEYFIENKGRLITRSEILDEIFKKNELVDSECNLSQHISLLRKSFRELGFLKELFITKRRMGMVMPKDIKVEKDIPIGVEPPEPSDVEDKVPVHPGHENKREIKVASDNFKSFFFKMRSRSELIVLSFSLFLVVAFFIYQKNEINTFTPLLSVYETYTESGCKIKTTVNNAPNVNKDKIEKYIKINSINCTDEDVIYDMGDELTPIKINSIVHCNDGSVVCHSYLNKE